MGITRGLSVCCAGLCASSQQDCKKDGFGQEIGFIAMAEKFRKIVAAPELAAKKLREMLEGAHTVEYVRARRREKVAAGQDDKHAGARDVVAIAGLGTMKWSAWMAAGGAQFMLWMARVMALDNPALRKMEEKYAQIDMQSKKVKDKKTGETKVKNPGAVKKFAQKYPNLSAHITWYFALATLIGGGYATYEYGPDVVESVKEWRMDRQATREKRNTYAAYLDKMRPLTPLLVADLIVKEGVHLDPNTGMHVPYIDSRGIPTIGFGSTVLKDGTSVTMKTSPITNEEAYELARHHIEDGETYFVMYCYDTAFDKVNINTTEEAFGLASIIYNAHAKLIENPDNKNLKERFARLRNLYDEYGYAMPDSLVRDAFAKYPVQDMRSFGEKWLSGADKRDMADKLGEFVRDGLGLYWRRWLEAGLLTGQITPQMLMKCPANGMFEFFKCMGKKKDAFFTGNSGARRVNYDTYEKFRAWLNNPVDEHGNMLVEARWPRVEDFLAPDIVAICYSGDCRLGNEKFIKHTRPQEKIEKETYVLGYDEMYASAIAQYNSKKYAAAASEFEAMLEQYPNNALLHNDLAATYNKLGRYDDAIAHAREIVRRIGDKSQYGAAQYNAGFAYEQKGDLQKALANYKLALANGNKHVQGDITRVKNKLQNVTPVNSKSKKTAFNAGRGNIYNAQNDFLQKVNMHGNNSNDMA